MELESVKSQTNWNEASSTINNNNSKIAIELHKLGNSTYKNKGYFKTLADLQRQYPTSSIGSIAYVGTSYPFSIYLWNETTSAWVNSGATGGDEALDLDNYYTKSEVEEKIKDYVVAMTQEEYDSLPTKEDKFYAIFE